MATVQLSVAWRRAASGRKFFAAAVDTNENACLVVVFTGKQTTFAILAVLLSLVEGTWRAHRSISSWEIK